MKNDWHHLGVGFILFLSLILYGGGPVDRPSQSSDTPIVKWESSVNRLWSDSAAKDEQNEIRQLSAEIANASNSEGDPVKESYERWLQLRLFILRRDTKDSASLLRTYHSDQVNQNIVELSISAVRLACEARTYGNDDEADAIEHNLLTIYDRVLKENARFNVVFESALYQGEYDFIINAGNVLDEHKEPLFCSFKFKVLAARAASAKYWAIYGLLQHERRWPTSAEASKLDEWSRNSTVAYEQTIALAPTPYDELVVAAEWGSLLQSNYYDADSRILRSALEDRINKPEKLAAVAAQTREFAECLRANMEKGRDSSTMLPEYRELFVQSCAAEFQRFACVGLSDRVFEDILRGLPQFVDEYFPLDVVAGPKPTGSTFRWYLWQAILQTHPDEVERKVIDAQLDEYLAATKEALDANVKKADKALENRYLDNLRSQFLRARDNTFISSYKRPMFAEEMRIGLKDYKVDLNRVSRDYQLAVSGTGQLPADQRTPEAYTFFADGYFKSVYNLFLTYTTMNARPGIQMGLPEEIIVSSVAVVNPEGNYVFGVGATVPLPAFPIHRVLLPEGNSKTRP